jgi:hypothetical protein
MSSVSWRWLPVGGLAWLAATALAAGPSADKAPDETTIDAAVIAVELNRAESLADGCRLSFVIHNRTPQAFETMQWDLFFFDPTGLIGGRMAAEVAPLRAEKTSVKLFDVPGIKCEGLGKVLINDVLRCETDSGAGTPIDCLQLTVPSSRAQVELIK